VTLPFDLGTLRVAAPAILLALLALPLLLATAAGQGRRTLAAAACRALAGAAVVLALAGAALERPRPEAGACIVAAVDVSASVGDAAIESARQYLSRILPALGDDDLVGTVAFAARARVVAHPAARARTLAALLPAPRGVADDEADESDLGAAVARATPLCPEGKQAAILLFTDGNETTGSLLAEAALGEPRLPIFPVVPPAPSRPPATLRRLLAPPLAPAHGLVPLGAVVEARAPLTAALLLDVDGEELPPVPLDLPAGVSVVPLPYRFDQAGHYLLEARLLLAPQTQPARGVVRTSMSVVRPIRALVVSEHGAPVLATALREHGITVDLVPPAGLAARLADYHLVVLDDVGSTTLAPATLAALERHVAAGGGLVVTGGEHLFGDAGFVAGPLERLLPVELQSQAPEPTEREPIALYLLIDRSNSMGYATSQPALQYGEKMEYAKRAALAVLDQLGPHDLVGAIAFDSRPYELGPLLPVARSRAALEAKIRALQYGGGTDFKDALELALQSLLESGRRVRHVILLTDGDTNRRADDHAALIGAYANSGITITTIRIGSDVVNLDLLTMISRLTGGEFHHVENVEALPQLMIHDTQRLLDTAANRPEAVARLGEPGPVLTGIAEEELPPIARWAVTRARPGAELRLWVEAGGRHDPILATWQYELGRVAVLPMDFQAGAAGWATWRGFGKLWTQLARWTAAPAVAGDRHLEAWPSRDGTLLALEAVAAEPGPFTLHVEPDADVLLRAVGPRRWLGLAPRLEPGRHVATLRTAGQRGEAPAGEAQAMDLFVPEGPRGGHESRSGGENLALLSRVATLSGGRMEPPPTSVLAARPGTSRRTVPLAGWLVATALALVVTGVALRRT
jgi:Mg-chelatase subunit ChlD